MKTRARHLGLLGIVALLLLVMALMLVVGCGGSTTTSSTVTTAPASTVSTPTTSAVSTTAGATTSISGTASSLPANAPEVVIGVDASMSGALAGFGIYQKWAADTAVADQNAKGGVVIDGVAHKLTIALLDDKSDPNVAASNVDTLITKNKAAIIFGPVTPAVSNPAALAAERRGVPYLETGTPTDVFTAVTKWKYAWCIFPAATDFTAVSFAFQKDLGIDSQLNHKVVLAAVNDADGPLFVAGWKAAAAANGWQATTLPLFSGTTTDFGSLIDSMKQSGADEVIVLGDTAPLVALRKQMDAVGYKPKVLDLERGSQLQQFSDSLSGLANGVVLAGYWWPDLPYAGAAALGQRFTTETGQSMSEILGYDAASMQIIIESLTSAGTADPAKINAAIGQTNGNYVCGPISFAADHTAKTKVIVLQWQAGKLVTVWPKDIASSTMIFPLP